MSIWASFWGSWDSAPRSHPLDHRDHRAGDGPDPAALGMAGQAVDGRRHYY